MKQGGSVFWRSSSKKPWYNALFVKYGFDVKPLAVRLSQKEQGQYLWKNMFQHDVDVLKAECIDRVNMYASFWVGVKQ